jgi:glutathione S-transferase
MKLYYHPRSGYSQKVLIALHEKRVSFTPEIVMPDDPRLQKITPIGKIPVLVLDDGWKIPESSIIIEYLDTHFSTGTRLIPEGRDDARKTRFFDRIYDLYIHDPVGNIFFKRGDVDAHRKRLDAMYTGLDEHLAKRQWIMGDNFTMADCALIPPLGYARELHPFDKHKNIAAYAARAFERPSVKKVHEELAPYLAKSA